MVQNNAPRFNYTVIFNRIEENSNSVNFKKEFVFNTSHGIITSQDKEGPLGSTCSIKWLKLEKHMYSPNKLDIIISINSSESNQITKIQEAFKSLCIDIHNKKYQYIVNKYPVFKVKVTKYPSKGVYEVYITAFSPDKFLTLDKFCEVHYNESIVSDIVKNRISSFANYAKYTEKIIYTDYADDDKSSFQHLRPHDKYEVDDDGMKLKKSGDKTEPVLPYLIQYNESFYDFLRRTLYRYGELMYFEGNSLHFGRQKELDKCVMTNSYELSGIDNEYYNTDVSFDLISPYIDYTDPTSSNRSNKTFDQIGQLACDAQESQMWITEDGTTKQRDIKNSEDWYNLIGGSILGVKSDNIAISVPKQVFKILTADSFIKAGADLLSKYVTNSITGVAINTEIWNKFKKLKNKNIEKLLGEYAIYKDSPLLKNHEDFLKIPKLREASGNTALQIVSEEDNFVLLGRELEIADVTGKDSYYITDIDLEYIECDKEKLEKENQNGVIDNKGNAQVSLLCLKITAVKEAEGGYVYSYHPEIPIFLNSGKQRAFVADNGDPLGLGRVRICYPWQNSFVNNPLAKKISKYEKAINSYDDKINDPKEAAKKGDNEARKEDLRKEFQKLNAEKQELINQGEYKSINTKTSPWVRVSQIMSSKTIGNAKGRAGVQFTPQVGDEVLIDYNYNNIEAPFVSGSLYNTSGNTSSMGLRSPYGHGITIEDSDEDVLGDLTAAAPIVDKLASFCGLFDKSEYKAEDIDVKDKLVEEGDEKDTAGNKFLEILQEPWDSLNMKHEHPYGGGVTISDSNGLYKIACDAGKRSISMESPMGRISMSSLQGISIDCPAGDLTINARNISMTAKNNLRIITGTGIPKNKSAADEFKDTIINKVEDAVTDYCQLLDLSSLRWVIDLFTKPIEGTLQIASPRNLFIQQGSGKLNCDTTKVGEDLKYIQSFQALPKFIKFVKRSLDDNFNLCKAVKDAFAKVDNNNNNASNIFDVFLTKNQNLQQEIRNNIDNVKFDNLNEIHQEASLKTKIEGLTKFCSNDTVKKFEGILNPQNPAGQNPAGQNQVGQNQAPQIHNTISQDLQDLLTECRKLLVALVAYRDNYITDINFETKMPKIKKLNKAVTEDFTLAEVLDFCMTTNGNDFKMKFKRDKISDVKDAQNSGISFKSDEDIKKAIRKNILDTYKLKDKAIAKDEVKDNSVDVVYKEYTIFTNEYSDHDTVASYIATAIKDSYKEKEIGKGKEFLNNIVGISDFKDSIQKESSQYSFGNLRKSTFEERYEPALIFATSKNSAYKLVDDELLVYNANSSDAYYFAGTQSVRAALEGIESLKFN